MAYGVIGILIQYPGIVFTNNAGKP